MFRKIANIFVLLLFVVSTTGFTISKHYCKGDLVSVSVGSMTKLNNNNSPNCCHSKNEHLQLKDEFTYTQNPNLNHSVNFEIIIFKIENIQIKEYVKNKDFNNTANGPPIIDRQFIYYIHQFKLAPPIC